MSTTTVDSRQTASLAPDAGARTFGMAFLATAIIAATFAGWAPLGVSIVTVFLFAGPHNWMEARFFLSRMPASWGRLKWYFLIGLTGIVTLTLGSLALPSFARTWKWGQGDWLAGIALWNTLLVGWILLLAEFRRRETGEEKWAWLMPAGFALIAVNCLWPLAWSLALVYLHPLIALWFLDRELRRRRTEWQRWYRTGLLTVPLLLGALWWQLAGTAGLPGDDFLSLQIANHAGAGILTNVSSQLLVATHVFLEMLHYAAWIVVIPLVGYAGKPWNLKKIPLVNRSGCWKIAIGGVLVIGALITVALWAGFLVDYPLTRDVYFSIAILHVLAEVPFLMRLL